MDLLFKIINKSVWFIERNEIYDIETFLSTPLNVINFFIFLSWHFEEIITNFPFSKL